MGGFLSHLTPEPSSDILNASCGPIFGNIYRHDDKIVDGYLGIPYAQPPIGPLRFKKPLLADTWTKPKDCTKYGPSCPQSGGFATIMDPLSCEYNEDNCLNLNVFAPRWKSDEFPSGLPVMVYIHGGAFEIGTSAAFHDYSLTGTLPLHDIIVVTINYRLGPLGFLTTGDDICNGNMGLWDQTLALQWVHNHIMSFGGDPDNVTIAGTSAGGASVDSLCPHTNGLFKNHMPMSGTGLCDFAIRTKEDQAKVFEEFAKYHGYHLFQISMVTSFQNNLKSCESAAYQKSDFLESLKFTLNQLLRDDIITDKDNVHKMLLEQYTRGVDLSDKKSTDLKLVNMISDLIFNHGALQTANTAAKYDDDVYLYSIDYFNTKTIFGPMLDQSPFHAANHGTATFANMGIDCYFSAINCNIIFH